MTTLLLRLAGVGQLVLIVGSLAIPKMLGWQQDTQKLQPLTRQVFWTYAGYIWATNLCFGLLSTFAPEWLLDGSPLSIAVAGYIAAYWLARVLIQFFYFDRSAAPEGKLFVLGEWALVGLFVGLTGTYGWVVWRGLAG